MVCARAEPGRWYSLVQCAKQLEISRDANLAELAACTDCGLSSVIYWYERESKEMKAILAALAWSILPREHREYVAMLCLGCVSDDTWLYYSASGIKAHKWRLRPQDVSKKLSSPGRTVWPILFQ